MRRVRVIPSLLLRGAGLVKTVRFKEPIYVGDPRNAVRIFNEKEVDELALLDITATIEKRPPRFELVKEIVSEAFMPVSYGGGVRTIEEAQKLLTLGVEKVILCTGAVEVAGLVVGASRAFGSQSVVVCMEVKRALLRRYEVTTHGGRRGTKQDPVSFAKRMEEAGAGELLVYSVDHDGTGQGYDLDLLRSVTSAVTVPVIACGGAGKIEDFRSAVTKGGASAVAAGSLFVFQGRHRAVLISYPQPEELSALFP